MDETTLPKARRFNRREIDGRVAIVAKATVVGSVLGDQVGIIAPDVEALKRHLDCHWPDCDFDASRFQDVLVFEHDAKAAGRLLDATEHNATPSGEGEG